MNIDNLKFRAWSIRERKYYYDIENAYSNDSHICSDIPDYRQGHPNYHNCFGSVIEDPGYITEQCIGLKDKNGNLIYENDVVVGSWNTKLIVFWDAISASYRVKPLDNCGGDRELHYYSNMDGNLYYNFEIIGNIHEIEVSK